MEIINNSANIFFFVTTIFVTILTIILIISLVAVVKIYKFIQKAVDKGDVFMEELKANALIKKAAPVILPVLMPILSFFFKINKKKR